MAYRFKLDESVNAGFRRIGLEQINRAKRELEDADPAHAVHGARKSLKRVRALLRLARPGLGEEAFSRENARFRGVADLLAGARDHHILFETAEKLERRSGPRAKAAFAAAREMLSGLPNGASREARPCQIGEATHRLRESLKPFKKLDVGPDGFAIFAKGLERSYRIGRRAFERAYEHPSGETFHEWRKGVQQHWRHMALLSRAWPDFMEARANEARELSQNLGDDHDLDMLASAARDGLNPKHARVVERHCRDQQADLRAAAWPRGLRLFAEKPGRLRRRVELYWSLAGRIASKDGLAPLSGEDGVRNGTLKRPV